MNNYKILTMKRGKRYYFVMPLAEGLDILKQLGYIILSYERV